MTAFGDKDVGGLDVAVNDAFGVSRVEGVGNFDGQGKNLAGLHRTARDAVLQGYAIQKLHGDEGLAVLLADIVNRTDVGVIQSGGGLGFALKTAERLGIASDFVGKEFQSDEAVQAGVLSLVNHAHAAATELFDDAIVGNGLADHF